MSEDTETLLLDYLKVLQAGQERIERQLEEQSYRLGRLEQVLSNLHQQVSQQEEALVGQSIPARPHRATAGALLTRVGLAVSA